MPKKLKTLASKKQRRFNRRELKRLRGADALSDWLELPSRKPSPF